MPVVKKPLTDAWVRALKQDPSRPRQQEFADGGCKGLRIALLKNGQKVWWYRDRKADTRVGLGTFPEMGVSAAREEADKRRLSPNVHAQPGTGAEKVPEWTVEALVESYLEEKKADWEGSTYDFMAHKCRKFSKWATSKDLRTAAQITPSAFAQYRAHVSAQPLRRAKQGGRRGDTISTSEKRSVRTINAELKAVKRMLHYLRKAKRLPGIQSSDDLDDNMDSVPDMGKSLPTPLKQAELKRLLRACLRHDAEEKERPSSNGRSRGPASVSKVATCVAPLVAVALLSGIREGELLKLTWEDVDLDDQVIRVHAGIAKMGRERDVELDVSPALARLLKALERSGSSSGKIFGFSKQTLTKARKRLVEVYGAPEFLWSTSNTRRGAKRRPTLRSTCGSYVVNAPGIKGGGQSALFWVAKQLGHRVEVAQEHYWGRLRRVSKTAKTIEAAMEIEEEVDLVIEQVAGRVGTRRRAALRVVSQTK